MRIFIKYCVIGYQIEVTTLTPNNINDILSEVDVIDNDYQYNYAVKTLIMQE